MLTSVHSGDQDTPVGFFGLHWSLGAFAVVTYTGLELSLKSLDKTQSNIKWKISQYMLKAREAEEPCMPDNVESQEKEVNSCKV